MRAIFDRQARSIGLPKPLKQRVIYTGAMTLCIAAVCQHEGSPRIVLCSDTKMDHGFAGATNKTVKFDVLGHGWSVLLAGKWDEAQWLFDRVQTAFGEMKTAPTVDDVLIAARDAGKALVIAPIYLSKKHETVDLILSGFVSGKAKLITVTVYKRAVEVSTTDSFCATGSGASIASVFLIQREYTPTVSLETATYLVYEAKKASEKDIGVGSVTVMMIQAPPSSIAFEDKVNIALMNDEGKNQLEEVRRRFGLQPLGDFDPFPDSFFVNLVK